MNEYNKKAIADIYKNAHIALQSINDILPQVDDDKLKKEIQSQRDGYTKIIDEISAFMSLNKLEQKDINIFAKASMWTSIKVKTMINNSKNQIAEMMIKGSVVGINELIAMKNEKERLNDGVKSLLEKLLDLEEYYAESLKAFL